MWHGWERGRTCTRFWCESPKEKRPLEKPRRRREAGIKMDLREIDWGSELWSGFTWLRIETVRGLL
jgi:hypothetical protein